MFNNYIPLHVHSDYSFLDSIAKISDLTQKARTLGIPGLALTDHGNICGWLKFYESCKYNKDGKPLPKDQALKPIFGIEAYITDDSTLHTQIEDRVLELEDHKKNSLGELFEYAQNPDAYEASDDREAHDAYELAYSQWSECMEQFCGMTQEEAEAAGALDYEMPRKEDFIKTDYSVMLDSKKNNNFDAESQIEKLKEYKNKIRKSNHLIILAKNKTGYKNIIKLSSYGFQNGLFYKPRIDMKVLEEYKDGLIVLSACLGGQISSNILKGDIEKAESYVKEYKRIFGEDFYLELQLHEIEEQKKANKQLIEFMKKHKIQPVITQDVHYVEKEDVELHEIVIKIRKHVKDDKAKEGKVATEEEKLVTAAEAVEQEKNDDEDSDGYFYSTRSLYFKSLQELEESWKKDHDYIHEKIFKKAIENTKVIFDKIEDISVRSDKPLLPTYDTGDLTPRQFILELIKKGAKEKLAHKLKGNKELESQYNARMKEELDTICDLNFEQYFLIEWDIMRWCKDNGVMTGPGRGSVAGSLIAYLLGITQIDPIEHDLLFSRFINKSRSGAKYKLEFDEIPVAVKS